MLRFGLRERPTRNMDVTLCPSLSLMLSHVYGDAHSRKDLERMLEQVAQAAEPACGHDAVDGTVVRRQGQ